MNCLFRLFPKCVPIFRNGHFVAGIQTFAARSNYAASQHNQSADDVIMSSVRVLSLFLGLPGIQLSDLPIIVKPIKSENLTRTLKIFQKTGKTLVAEGFSCKDLFHQASSHHHDPVRVAEAILEVSQFHGSEKAMSLLQTNVNGLIRLAEKTQVQRRLEQSFQLEDLHPSYLLIQELKKSPSRIISRIRKFEQVLPKWCLKKLIEGYGITWFLRGSHHLMSILRVLEESLSSVMSTKTAKEGSLVCITRCTEIVDQTPNHLKHRIQSLRNSVLCEDFGDLVLNYPRLLSPHDSIDLSARHREVMIWSAAISAEIDVFTVDSKILVLPDKSYGKVLERLKYVALMGNDGLSNVHRFLRLSSSEFKKLYPDFSRWIAVFVDQQPDENYMTQLQLHIEQTFEQIEKFRFVQKFPVFQKAFARMSAPIYSSRCKFLLSYFGRSLLGEVTSFRQAQYLLMMSENLAKEAETKLQSELPFKQTTIKKLILSYPKFFLTLKTNQKLDKKLLADSISV